MKKQHPLLELPVGLMTLFLEIIGSERHRYAIG